MNVSILTVFPDLYQPFLSTSLIGRAQEDDRIKVDLVPFFSCAKPKERIDAPVYGHGAGMLIKPEIVEAAVDAQEEKYGKAYKIFFSPQGKKLDQHQLKKMAQKLSSVPHLMLVAARYEGMDVRVEQEYADELISIGDFVLMGGDLPAMVLIEGLLRLVPGVVGKPESVAQESFSGPFIDYPTYTQPLEWRGKKVPDVVRSGNHGAVTEWRHEQAVSKTVVNHFGWLRTQQLSKDQIESVQKYIPPHYVALLHADVLTGPDRIPGVTSVTSIDIHDIARTSCSYGVKEFFIVTPLLDQQRIVTTLLDFWQKGAGIEYNPNRHQAVDLVSIQLNIEDVIAHIEKKEGKKPLVIATSAQYHEHKAKISFFDQDRVWEHNRPVLFIFGTGKGLTEDRIQAADFLLLPVHGLSGFNHLSVRSAVGIVLDRWIGINEKTIR